MNKYTHLLSPFKINKLPIKNRLATCPMALTNIDDPITGGFNPIGEALYVGRAKGGFGLIVAHSTSADIEVDPLMTVAPLNNPAGFVGSSVPVIERIHTYGTKIFKQITMGLGRNYGNMGMKAPSPIPAFLDPSFICAELTNEEIKKKIDFVVQTAAVVKSAGYDGIEVHAMHWGYLLDQFAIAYMNHRTDEYGGVLENRLRAAKEIVQGIKQVCGSDFPVSMRLGLKSYIKGYNNPSLTGEEEVGRTVEEAVEIAKLLEAYGYDVLNTDVGLYDSFYYQTPPMYVEEGFFLDAAEAVKKAVNIPVMVGGGRLNDPDLAEKAIAEGKMDAVALGRATLADPDYAKKIEMGKPETIRPCIGCNQGCIARAFVGQNVRCAVNPSTANEAVSRICKTSEPKKIAVIGGGVAGMEFARVATQRGHSVDIYEKSDVLGGNMIAAGSHGFKYEVKSLTSWHQTQLKELGVPVHTGVEMKAADIAKLDADAVVLAVGASPAKLNIPGIDNPKAVGCIEATLGQKPLGNNVVIIGGGLVGSELALDLAKDGKKVTIVEMLDDLMLAGTPETPFMNRDYLKDSFIYLGVNVLAGTKLLEINDNGALLEGKDGEKTQIDADNVVIATGFKANPNMSTELQGCGKAVYVLGDTEGLGSIMNSTYTAYELACEI